MLAAATGAPATAEGMASVSAMAAGTVVLGSEIGALRCVERGVGGLLGVELYKERKNRQEMYKISLCRYAPHAHVHVLLLLDGGGLRELFRGWGLGLSGREMKGAGMRGLESGMSLRNWPRGRGGRRR